MKKPFFTKVRPELLKAMDRYREVVGVPLAVQVDKALTEWLSERQQAWGLPKNVKAGKRRAVTRRKP